MKEGIKKTDSNHYYLHHALYQSTWLTRQTDDIHVDQQRVTTLVL